jgi:hypothetical protein
MFFVADLSNATLRTNDLRDERVSLWGDQLTQRASLVIDSLSLRLPVRANGFESGGWTSPVIFAPVAVECLAERVIAGASAHSRLIAQGEVLEPAAIHKYMLIRLPWGKRWSRPLGVDIELVDVEVEYTYSVVHPVVQRGGPAVQVRGSFTTSWPLFERAVRVHSTIQLDQMFASGRKWSSAVLSGHHSSMHVQSSDILSGSEVANLFLLLNSTQETGWASFPFELQRISTSTYSSCLATADVWLEGPLSRGLMGTQCAAGFHMNVSAMAWGTPARLRMDAALEQPVGSTFSFASAELHVDVLEPNDFLAALQVGIKNSTGGSRTRFIGSMRLSRVEALLHLNQIDGPTPALTLTAEGQISHEAYLVKLRLDLPFTSTTPGWELSNMQSIEAAAALAWPASMAVSLDASEQVSLHELLLKTLATFVTTTAGDAIPEVFHFLKIPHAQACIAGSGFTGYCSAGIHGVMALNASSGFFGIDSQLSLSSVEELGCPIGRMAVDVLAGTEAVAVLLPFVLEGILATLSPDRLAGARRYLAGMVIDFVLLSWADGAEAPANLTIALISELWCEQRNITLPLSRFLPFAWAEQTLTAQHLEKAISSIPTSEMLAILAHPGGSRAADFDDAVDLPALVATQRAQLAPPDDGMQAFISQLNVCTFGMYIRSLELTPPPAASALCESVTLLLERADTLRLDLVEGAACGKYAAAYGVAKLSQHEERLAALPPATAMAKCLQLHSLFGSVRASVSLPADSLRRNLRDLDLLLEGLEAAWEGDRQIGMATAASEAARALTEADSIIPNAVAKIQVLLEWPTAANNLVDALRRVAGVLSAQNALHPSAMVELLQGWGTSLQSLLETVPSALPDMGKKFLALRLQMATVVDNADALVGTFAHISSEIASVVREALSELQDDLDRLNPAEVEEALKPLATVDFDKIDTLLDTAKDFLEDSRNMVGTMDTHRANVDESTCGGPTGCVIGNLRAAMDNLQKLLTSRNEVAVQGLGDLPTAISATLSSLEGLLASQVSELSACASTLFGLAAMLQDYFRATADVLDNPTAAVSSVSNLFFSALEDMLAKTDMILASVDLVRSGRSVIDSLTNAASTVTAAAHAKIAQETQRVHKYFAAFTAHFLPPSFQSMMPYLKHVLVPAADTIARIEDFLRQKELLDHLLKVPKALLTRLLAFENRLGTLPRPASLVPSVSALQAALDAVFQALPELQSELADPSGECREDSQCQVALQIRVRTVREHLRELQRQLRLLQPLSSSLRAPLLATVDLMDVAEVLIPDLEITSVWARELAGGAPELREGTATAATAAAADAALPEIVAVPIQRQLLHALCQEAAIRSAQGRQPTTSPALNLDLKCEALSGTVFGEEESPFDLAVREAASSWGLFQKLADAAQFLKGVCDAQIAAMSDAMKVAVAISGQWIIPMASFATTFKGVKEAFASVPPLRGNMHTVFDLEACIQQIERDAKEKMDTGDLASLGLAASAALRRAAQAPAPPFKFLGTPQSCAAVPEFSQDTAASIDELTYERASGGRLVLPLTLLTGLGDGLCIFRAGVTAIIDSIGDSREPLETKAFELFQGAAALRGKVPACLSTDPYCLATVTRADLVYKLVNFAAFYLHFFSLSAPSLISMCRTAMKQRFVIPGLFSAYSMQSSAFLAHDTLQIGDFSLRLQCERYTHLLGYAPPADSLGCTRDYQSFFATVDVGGVVWNTHPISFPDGTPYRGSLTSLAVSTELNTVWACGKSPDEEEWSIHSFALSELTVPGFTAPGTVRKNGRPYGVSGVRMCHTQQLKGFGSGKAKCTVNWDKKKQWLWAGNTAQPGEDGVARAYGVISGFVCPGGGDTIAPPAPFHRRIMRFGPHVSAFAFLTDVLDDDYVAIARCHNYNRNSGPCLLEFYSVTRGRYGDMDLTAVDNPVLAMRIPSGLGSLVHDTSLGVPSTEGGYFHASFIGTTPANVDATEAQGGDPEVRAVEC